MIGASAGGVPALTTLVAGLPADFPAAVCIVMHLSPDAPSRLAQILGREAALPVVAAADGDVIEAGRIYTPTADRHLMVHGRLLRLTRGPKECRVRPSIDVLFRSAAASAGSRVVGVVLTGMLDDGTAGLWAIQDRDGQALVQSPETAEYPSMPESAAAHVRVDAALPVERLAAEIVRRVAAMRSTHVDVPPPSPRKLAIETSIASEGNSLKAGVLELGDVSTYTCPECHGVLVQIVEGPVTRFRCHTGHAFSMKTLLSDVNEAIDTGLWSALRAIEERALLLGRMAEMSTERGDRAVAERCRAQVADALKGAEAIRALVLDDKLFGHTPGSSD